MGTIAAEALAATTARKVLKPMPASSWCHMWLALGCAAHSSGLRHGVPAVLRACATALKLRK